MFSLSGRLGVGWVAIGFLFVCSMANAEAPRKVTQGKFEYYVGAWPDWVRPAAMPTPVADSEPAKMVLRDTQFRVTDTSEVFIRRVLQANQPNVLGEVGKIIAQYNPTYNQLTWNTLRIIRGSESVDKLNSATFRILERETQLEQNMINGTVSIIAVIEDLRVGDMLEYAYTINGVNPVYGKKFSDSAGIDGGIPVQNLHIRLVAGVDRKINSKVHGIKLKESESINNGWRETTWLAENIPAAAAENGMPIWHIPYSWLQFTEYNNWQEVTAWADTLFAVPTDLNDEVMKVVSRIEAAKGDDEYKVREALMFVQNDIRYFGTELGESSHRPAHPNTVIQQRFGDCKDKTMMLVALLRKMGINASPALVNQRNGRAVENWLPSPVSFDHVVTRVEINGDTHWIDATLQQQLAKLKYIYQPTSFERALVLGQSSRKLETMKALRDTPVSTSDISEVFIVDKSISATRLELTSKYRGPIAEYLRGYLKSTGRDAQERAQLNSVTKRYPKAKLVAPFQIEDDTEENVLSIKEIYDVADFLSLKDKLYSGRAVAINILQAAEMPDTLVRKTPLRLSYPSLYKYSFEVQLPQSVKATFKPYNDKIRNDYVDFFETYSFSGNLAKGEYSFNIRADHAPAKDVLALSADLRKIRERTLPVINIPKDMLLGTTTAPPKNTDQHADAEMLNNAVKVKSSSEKQIEQLSKQLENPQLTPAVKAEFLLDRAIAYSYVSNHQAALADYGQSLKLAPKKWEVLVERASTLIAMQRIDEALADVNQATALGGDSANLYYTRGQILFFLKRYADAQLDFQRATVIHNKSEKSDNPYYTAWLLMAGKRNNANLNALVEEGANQKTIWPYAVINLFLDGATPEQVLAASNHQDNEKDLLNKCEAYFFIGEYHMQKGDVASARDAFNKSVATKATMYLEYNWSRYEIGQVAAK